MKKQQLLVALEQEFYPLQNQERALQQQRYTKSSLPYFGIPKPEITAIAKRLAKAFPPKDHDEYAKTILYLFNNAQRREIWYSALDYAMVHKKYIIPESIPTYLEIIRFAAWWDIVDTVADHLVGKALLKTDDIQSNLKLWIHDEHMWIRRTALIAQLKYKSKTNINILAYCITTTMHEKEFFIRKAIGWALRQYSYTNPEWVIQFIEEHRAHLSPLSIREGLKAIKRTTI